MGSECGRGGEDGAGRRSSDDESDGGGLEIKDRMGGGMASLERITGGCRVFRAHGKGEKVVGEVREREREERGI